MKYLLLLCSLLIGFLSAKELDESLVYNEVFTFRVTGGGLLSRWDETYRGYEDIVSVPPLFQIFLAPVAYDSRKMEGVQMQMVVYDASKRKVVSNTYSTNRENFFTWRLSQEPTLTNGFSPSWKGEIKKDFIAYCKTNEMTISPTAFRVSSNISVFIGMGSEQEFSKEDAGYILVFVKTKNEIFTLKKWIEPKKEYPAHHWFANKWPLNWRQDLFLQADLDGNGTQELIFAAGGRQKNRWMTYYNIFFFDDLVKYLKDKKIESIL